MSLFTGCRGQLFLFGGQRPGRFGLTASTPSLKDTIRRTVFARRDALSVEDRIDRSLAIAQHGADIDVEPGVVISGFWPIRSEVDVRPLLFALRERGARLCLPAVLDKTTIEFREFLRDAELTESGWGTTGPAEGAAVVDPDVMLMPLAGFDRTGNRIGYGAGHFDRAIARLHGNGKYPTLIGVAFACQETDAVPSEPHDVPLHAVLTENGLHNFAASA